MQTDEMFKKNRIVICELYHDFLHGADPNNQVNGHYLVIDSFQNFYEESETETDSDSESESNTINSDININSESDEESEEEDSLFEDEDNFEMLTLCVVLHRGKYQELMVTPRFVSTQHKTIRNYHHIVSNPLYIQPQIAECFYLQNHEFVCVLKTFWIRLIQRTWKRIYQERKNISQRRMTISSLKQRELTGRWPPGLNAMPSVYGMLNYLNLLVFP
jgi:hypothetical protein